MSPRVRPGGLWGRDFVLATGANLFMSMVFYLLMTSMALYAVERFGAGDAAAGFASSSYIVGALVARMFAGQLVGALGLRRTLLVSFAAFTLFSFLYIPSDSLGMLLAVRLLHGVAFGAGNTAVTATVQAVIPPARRGEGTGYFSLSTSVSTAVGPFVAAVLAARGDYAGIFWFCTASSLAGLAVAAFLRPPETPAAQRPRLREVRWLHPGSMVERRTLPIATIALLTGAAYSGVLAFLSTYSLENGTPRSAALFFAVYAAVVMVSRLVAGRIQDRRGDNVVMYPAIVMFAGGLALLSLPPTAAVAAASAVLCGLGFGIIMPCAQAIAVAQAPEGRMATAVSTYYLMLDVGTGLGPVLLGALVPLTGFGGMYAVLGAATLGTVAVYRAVHGRPRRR